MIAARVAAQLEGDATLDVRKVKGGLGELRVTVDGTDVVDTNRLWYPTPTSVVERVRAHLVDIEVSVGDVVLSGGELPALLVLDAVARLVPGVLGSEGSLAEESFEGGLLEYPQYTRPAEFRGWRVPDVLVSGNHGEVDRWRRQQRLLRTRTRRPDLLAGAEVTPQERAWLDATPEVPLD